MDIIQPLAAEIAHAYSVKHALQTLSAENGNRTGLKESVWNGPLDVPRKPFQQLRAWERQSNQWAAAHLNVKLAVIGKQVVPRMVASNSERIVIDDKDKQVMAKMEHNRYLAERLMSGWTFGQAEVPENKRRFALVDWDHLPNRESAKDSDQIDLIFHFLRQHPHVAISDIT